MTVRSEWSKFVALPDLGLQALHAHYVRHEYERHWHDFYVIGVVDGGAPNFSLHRERVTAPAGTAMVINPGEAHDGRASDDGGYVYSMVYVDHRVVRALAEELDVAFSSSLAFEVPVIDDGEVVARILLLHRALMRGSSRLECDVRLIDTLKLLIHRFSASRPNRLPDVDGDRRIRWVRDYIHANFDETMTTTDLAAASGLGRARLNDLFRTFYGLPLHSYLNAVRMSAARDFLLRGMPAAEVAAAVGLSDQSHLIRRFKGSFGITPSQFSDGHYTNIQSRWRIIDQTS